MIRIVKIPVEKMTNQTEIRHSDSKSLRNKKTTRPIKEKKSNNQDITKESVGKKKKRPV